MAHGRMLKKVISKSKKVASLKNNTHRLIYTWIIPHLDIKGRHEGCVSVIKGFIFPRIKSITIKKIESALLDMVDVGLIKRYIVNDDTYIEYIDFAKYQILREDKEAKSDIPDPTTVALPDNSRSTPAQAKQSKHNISKEKRRKEKKSKATKDMPVDNPKKAAEFISSIGNLPKTPIEKGDVDNDRDGEFWETNEDERLLMIVSYQARFREQIDHNQSYLLLNEPPNPKRLKVQKEWCNSYQRPWFELVTCAMDQLVDRSKKKKINNVFGALYDGVFSFPPYLIVVEK